MTGPSCIRVALLVRSARFSLSRAGALALLLWSTASAAGPDHSLTHHCKERVSLVITGSDRFDPWVQQLLLKEQLDGRSAAPLPQFLVIPHLQDLHLTAAQIQYLEQMLKRRPDE